MNTRSSVASTSYSQNPQNGYGQDPYTPNPYGQNPYAPNTYQEAEVETGYHRRGLRGWLFQ